MAPGPGLPETHLDSNKSQMSAPNAMRPPALSTATRNPSSPGRKRTREQPTPATHPTADCTQADCIPADQDECTQADCIPADCTQSSVQSNDCIPADCTQSSVEELSLDTESEADDLDSGQERDQDGDESADDECTHHDEAKQSANQFAANRSVAIGTGPIGCDSANLAKRPRIEEQAHTELQKFMANFKTPKPALNAEKKRKVLFCLFWTLLARQVPMQATSNCHSNCNARASRPAAHKLSNE